MSSALGDGHAQHPARSGRQHRALGHLLLDDATVAAHGGQIAVGHVKRRPGLIKLGLRADTPLHQFLRAIEIGFGLITGRLLGTDTLIERLHLQNKLLVGDGGDHLSRGDDVALARGQRRDRAADPGARDKLMDGLHRRDNRLAVLDIRDGDGEVRPPRRDGRGG